MAINKQAIVKETSIGDRHDALTERINEDGREKGCLNLP